MSKYPPADAKTQWFQDNFPGAVMNPNVGLLHTTEGFDWPGYEGGATAPNYTAKPDIKGKGLRWRQHYPDERSSRSLVNLPGGVETNTLNVIQVELVGTCDPKHRTSWSGKRAGVDYIFWPDAPDWLLRELAKFIAYLHRQHGVPLVAPTFKAYPGSAGTNNGVRFTFARWHTFEGICGHQHAPENVHGDPGNLDVPKVLEMAKAILNPKPEPQPQPDPTPAPKPAPELTVIGWNAHVTNSAANVEGALTGWIKDHNPDVICVSEARTHRDVLRAIPGYRNFQEPRATNIGGIVNDQGDSAILVRSDLVSHIKRHSVAGMLLHWVVSRHHKTHTPRRYEKVVLKKGGVKFRIRASHWPTNGFDGPNRKAFLESATRSKAWLLLGVRSVSIDVGDLNDNRATIADWFGKRFKVRGSGIDMIVARRAASIDHTVLDKGGSDHHAQLYVVTARGK